MTDQLQPTAHTHPYTPTAPGQGYGPVPPAGQGYDNGYGYGYGYGNAYGYGAGPSGLGDAGWPAQPGVDPRGGYVGPGGTAGRGRGGWIIGGAVVLVLLLVAGVATLFLTLGGSTPAAPAAAPPAPVATAPVAPPGAATVPSAPSVPSVPSAPSAGAGSGSGRTLSTVFTASTGSACGAYTPTGSEYVTSRGNQASEVRVCAPGSSGIVFTRWASAADASSVVSDQASFPSVDGKSTWTMGGTTQGDWHERQLSDGSCLASFDYTGKPYAVMITAPSCSAVGQLFQDTPLPDISTVPAT